MVNFRNETVDIVLVLHTPRKRSRDPVVSGCSWKNLRENVGQCGTRGHTITQDQRLCRRNLVRQRTPARRKRRIIPRYKERKIRSDSLALPFIRAEKECPIFHQRSTQRSPEIVVPKRALYRRSAIEIISRIHRAVPQELERRTVKVIAA